MCERNSDFSHSLYIYELLSAYYSYVVNICRAIVRLKLRSILSDVIPQSSLEYYKPTLLNFSLSSRMKALYDFILHSGIKSKYNFLYLKHFVLFFYEAFLVVYVDYSAQVIATGSLYGFVHSHFASSSDHTTTGVLTGNPEALNVCHGLISISSYL